MDDLYDTDILAWSQRQAAVLRDLAARRDLPNELDLDHVAEEIEDVGRSELNAVQSFIRLCLVHIVKAACSLRIRGELTATVSRSATDAVESHGTRLISP